MKKDPTARQVVQYLEDVIFSRHGIPEVVHSDRGTNLSSQLMQKAAEIGRFTLSSSYSYTPRSQGNIERFQKTLTRILRKWIFQFPSISWDELLPAALFAYRVTIHKSTHFSPFFLIYGRDPKLPFGLEIGHHLTAAPTEQEVDDFAFALASQMIRLWDESKRFLHRSQDVNDIHFRKKSAKMPNIRLTDHVMLHHPLVPKNSGLPFRTGPYVVKRLLSTGAIISPVHPPCDPSDCTECERLYFVSLHRLKLLPRPRVASALLTFMSPTCTNTRA